MLKGRHVAIYVSGSIAAFKVCDVVTGLRKQGAEVRVLMTRGATRFVTPLTFQSLSGNPVATDDAQNDGMVHLDVAQWCDVQVAGACTADLLARLALGLADDVVTSTALACTKPLLIAPAMETAMWEHPATQGHVATLKSRGAVFIGPTTGRLASGKEGMGRMVEPAEIIAAVARTFSHA